MVIMMVTMIMQTRRNTDTLMKVMKLLLGMIVAAGGRWWRW